MSALSANQVNLMYNTCINIKGFGMEKKYDDLSGSKFGDWTVILKADNRKDRTYWLCECVCGKQKEVNASSLKRGISTNCGCAKRLDIVGQKFNMLTAIKYSHSGNGGESIYEFKCDCGNTTLSKASAVNKGTIKSCGCLQDRTTHGKSRSHTHKVWSGMKQRCLNENAPDYDNYGARGVSVCERWLDFNLFLEDLGEIPSDKEIDRIDNNGNYELGNVRFSTRKEQMQNMSSSKVWVVNGVEYGSSRDASKATGISPSQIGRMCNGYTRYGKYNPPKDGCYSKLKYGGTR